MAHRSSRFRALRAHRVKGSRGESANADELSLGGVDWARLGVAFVS